MRKESNRHTTATFRVRAVTKDEVLGQIVKYSKPDLLWSVERYPVMFCYMHITPSDHPHQYLAIAHRFLQIDADEWTDFTDHRDDPDFVPDIKLS